MVKFKKRILWSVIVFWSGTALAVDPMAFDAARATSNLPSENAGRAEQLQAQKMKNDQNAEQNKSYSEKCGAELPELTGAYTFMENEYFSKLDQFEHNSPKKTKDEALKFIKEKYFHDSGEPLTPEMEEKIRSARQAYNQSFQEQVRSLSAGVLEKLTEDKKQVEQLSAQTCGILEDIAVDSTVVQALIRQTIAEVGFQIALLERTVLDTLQTEPIPVLEKPEEIEEGAQVVVVPALAPAPPKPEGPVINPGKLSLGE